MKTAAKKTRAIQSKPESTKKKPYRGGAPVKSTEDKRTIRHTLVFNPKEHAKIQSMYNSSNFNNLNDFIRAMIFENSVKLYFEDKNKEEQIFQLSKIGGNFNQLVRNMNRMKNNYNSISEKEFKVIEEMRHYLSNLKI